MHSPEPALQREPTSTEFVQWCRASSLLHIDFGTKRTENLRSDPSCNEGKSRSSHLEEQKLSHKNHTSHTTNDKVSKFCRSVTRVGLYTILSPRSTSALF